MHHNTITATVAIRTFSDLLNKVHYQGKTFEIKRGREIIARICPAQPTEKGLLASELNEFFTRLPSLEKEDAAKFKKTIREIRSMKPEKDPWD